MGAGCEGDAGLLTAGTDDGPTWLLHDLPMSNLVAAYTDDESCLTQQGNMLANHATANT